MKVSELLNHVALETSDVHSRKLVAVVLAGLAELLGDDGAFLEFDMTHEEIMDRRGEMTS
jgi:hypothetical protein